MEWYSRGWRGAPAKGVGRVTGARVQIPLTPPLRNIPLFYKGFIMPENKKPPKNQYQNKN